MLNIRIMKSVRRHLPEIKSPATKDVSGEQGDLEVLSLKEYRTQLCRIVTAYCEEQRLIPLITELKLLVPPITDRGLRW